MILQFFRVFIWPGGGVRPTERYGQINSTVFPCISVYAQPCQRAPVIHVCIPWRRQGLKVFSIFARSSISSFRVAAQPLDGILLNSRTSFLLRGANDPSVCTLVLLALRGRPALDRFGPTWVSADRARAALRARSNRCWSRVRALLEQGYAPSSAVLVVGYAIITADAKFKLKSKLKLNSKLTLGCAKHPPKRTQRYCERGSGTRLRSRAATSTRTSVCVSLRKIRVVQLSTVCVSRLEIGSCYRARVRSSSCNGGRCKHGHGC